MKNKKGISLIVLVITIIVMIILAASVVITLSNTGIINKANQAVNVTSAKQVEQLANIIWAEAYADKFRGEELEREVFAQLENNGINPEEWGITVTDKGVTINSNDNNSVISVGAEFSDGTFLTWEELKLAENGTKYGYNASSVTDNGIGMLAFMGCNSLVSIVIPEGVTTIGAMSFERCASLVDLVVPSSVTSIGLQAFNQCTSLVNVTLSEGLTNIGTFSFCYTSIKDVILPSTVTSIGTNVFTNSGITSITIPKSVTSIDYDAFTGCTSLTKIIYTGTMEEWGLISLQQSWNLSGVPVSHAECSDGRVALSAIFQ